MINPPGDHEFTRALSSVVIVNDFAHVNGGAAQVALAEAKGLASRGAKVALFAAVGPVAKDLFSSGVDVVCLDQQEIALDPNRWRASRQGIWNGSAAARLSELLREHDPVTTIVHVHGWTKALSSSVIRTATDAGFPVVITLHDYFTACPNGGFFNYQSNEICRLTGMSARCVCTHCDKQSYSHKLYRVVRQAAQRRRGRVPGHVRNYISVSQLELSVLQPYLPGDARIFPLSNPVSLDITPATNLARNTLFVGVGRLSSEKGPFLFAEAARRAGVPALWVGDGELRNEMNRHFPELQVTGWLSHREVTGYLRASRALVFSSLCYETQGIAVLEAAAVGVPAIVPDSSAAREYVADRQTGLWFAGGDVNDLTIKILELNDLNLAARLGADAHERYWITPPTLERHIQELESIYGQILESHATHIKNAPRSADQS